MFCRFWLVPVHLRRPQASSRARHGQVTAEALHADSAISSGSGCKIFFHSVGSSERVWRQHAFNPSSQDSNLPQWGGYTETRNETIAILVWNPESSWNH